MEQKVTAAQEAEKTCVHCGLCTKNCSFLSKYKIDIGSRKELEKLAYHCFLCGKCTEVCPKGIDGREVILNARREQVKKNGGKIKGYGMLLWEKEDYKFRNYKNAGGTSVFFPGCNFPSFYPRTTKYLSEFLKEKAGMGTVFDCCGKPVAELGLENREEELLREMDERLRRAGIRELVTACPNCYHFLYGRLSVKVTGIYEKLDELGGFRLAPEGGTRRMFLPCPEREDRVFLSQIQKLSEDELISYEDGQCCGLGGCAGKEEPELAREMPKGIPGEEHFLTYCASCTGNLARKGYLHAEHVLPKILGTEEAPDTRKSLWNRVKTKYRREK